MTASLWGKLAARSFKRSTTVAMVREGAPRWRADLVGDWRTLDEVRGEREGKVRREKRVRAVEGEENMVYLLGPEGASELKR